MKRFAVVFTFVLLLVLLSGGLIVWPCRARRQQAANTILRQQFTWAESDCQAEPVPLCRSTKPEVEVRKNKPDETTLTARVVDMDTGQPVAGARVRINVYEGRKRRLFNTTSGEDGIFPVPKLSQERVYSIVVEHPDYACFTRAGEGRIVDSIEMAKGAKITGYVRDETGAPLPPWKVEFQKVAISCFQVAVSGNRFEISQLREKSYRVYVQPEGFYRKAINVSLKRGETTTIDVVFERGIEVFGTVRDMAGSPIEGVSVIRHSSPREFDPYQEFATTDSLGRFSFRWAEQPICEVAPWRLSFMKDGYKYQWIAKWDERLPAEIVIVKGNSASSIKGSVTASGVPFEGTLYVDYKLVKEDTIPYIEVKKGQFQVNGILPGKHTVTVQARGYFPITATVEVPAERPGRLDLTFTDKGGQVTGRVIDALGRPVSARVRCFKPDGPLIGPYHTHTDATGKYTIGGLSDGSYNIQADPKTSTGLVMSKAVTVTVTRGNVIKNVDFVLDTKSK